MVCLCYWFPLCIGRLIMNKLIKQFERESNLDVYSLGLDRVKWEDRLRAYTELIVRECADIGERYADGNYEVRNQILERFGIEEE